MDIFTSSEAFCIIECLQLWITTACQQDSNSDMLSDSALAGDLLVRGKQNILAMTCAQLADMGAAVPAIWQTLSELGVLCR